MRATGATAGVAPAAGTWTPAGAAPRANLLDMTAAPAVVASPATAWTSGQRMRTADNANVTWSGVNWVGGIAP